MTEVVPRFRAASRTHDCKTCGRCTNAVHTFHWCVNRRALGLGPLPRADAKDKGGKPIKVCGYCGVKPKGEFDE